MKTIKCLIEKYEKEIQSCEKEMVEEPEFSEGFEGEKHIYEIVVRDLKEYEKSILFDKISEMGPEVEQEQNYPPLRERLIESIVGGIMANNSCDPNGMDHVFQNIAQDAISQADAIINQLNKEK